MNERKLLKYIEGYIKDALRNSDGSPKGAYERVLKKGSTVKTILLTGNPTEKTDAAQIVKEYFWKLSSDVPNRRLQTSEVMNDIRVNLNRSWILEDLAIIRTYGKRDKKSRRAAKDAKRRISENLGLGDESTSILKQYLDEALDA